MDHCSHPRPADPSAKVHSQLAWILSQPDALPPHPLGYLTAINRDQWAELHQELVSK